MKTLLVTGGAGFIGSNLVLHLLKKYPDYTLINLDKLTYAGDLKNLAEAKGNPNHIFVEGDILDSALLDSLFTRYNIQHLIHLAAESHVDNSIAGPEIFIQTNLVGTFRLLETAKKFWLSAPHNLKFPDQNPTFHHVSTDEVYGSLGPTGLFSETSPYAPNSPYSASKAGSDMLARSYFHTYGLPVVITNCSNNFGPKQHGEKLIPTIIRNALQGNPIPIYGQGTNIRDWLYVGDHCQALDLVFHKGQAGETYCIGADNEKTNLDLAKKICGILDELAPRSYQKSYSDLIQFVTDRPGHDLRYAIDSSKLKTTLGWKQSSTFEANLLKTVEWYIQQGESLLDG